MAQVERLEKNQSIFGLYKPSSLHADSMTRTIPFVFHQSRTANIKNIFLKLPKALSLFIERKHALLQTGWLAGCTQLMVWTWLVLLSTPTLSTISIRPHRRTRVVERSHRQHFWYVIVVCHVVSSPLLWRVPCTTFHLIEKEDGAGVGVPKGSSGDARKSSTVRKGETLPPKPDLTKAQPTIQIFSIFTELRSSSLLLFPLRKRYPLPPFSYPRPFLRFTCSWKEKKMKKDKGNITSFIYFERQPNERTERKDHSGSVSSFMEPENKPLNSHDCS